MTTNTPTETQIEMPRVLRSVHQPKGVPLAMEPPTPADWECGVIQHVWNGNKCACGAIARCPMCYGLITGVSMTTTTETARPTLNEVKQLIQQLQNAAWSCGTDEYKESVSDAAVRRRHDAMQQATTRVLDSHAALVAENAALRAACESAYRWIESSGWSEGSQGRGVLAQLAAALGPVIVKIDNYKEQAEARAVKADSIVEDYYLAEYAIAASSTTLPPLRRPAGTDCGE